MVIDDEQGVCDILKRLFEQEKYDVSTHNDPEKALEALFRDKPHGVLLDIKMPKMDGIEVLSRVKQFDPRIKVIMITGYGNIENAMESMKLGAYDYITKPFDLDFIKSLVKRALGE
jgi:two-component system response regulator AtoC